MHKEISQDHCMENSQETSSNVWILLKRIKKYFSLCQSLWKKIMQCFFYPSVSYTSVYLDKSNVRFPDMWYVSDMTKPEATGLAQKSLWMYLKLHLGKKPIDGASKLLPGKDSSPEHSHWVMTQRATWLNISQLCLQCNSNPNMSLMLRKAFKNYSHILFPLYYKTKLTKSTPLSHGWMHGLLCWKAAELLWLLD